MRAFRRTERAIDAALRLIESSRRAIDACERFASVRPIRATQQLERVSGWIVEATEQLGLVVSGLSETCDSAARALEEAGEAPGMLINATARWIDAAARLAALSDRLDCDFAELVDRVKCGDAPLDLDALFRKPDLAPRPISIRRPSVKRLSIENSRIFCIHIRRRRTARLTIVEAPGRIFRGRAPPILSTCSL
jgi:hypothetical protein